MRIQYVKCNEFDTPTTLSIFWDTRYQSLDTRPTHCEQGEGEEGDDEVLQGAGGQPHVTRDLRVTGEYTHLAVLYIYPQLFKCH